jgi:hypothetical protein
MKEIPQETMEELAKYARENGRNWKSKLRHEWMYGSETLRWVRNAIGPDGLDGIKLPKENKSA